MLSLLSILFIQFYPLVTDFYHQTRYFPIYAINIKAYATGRLSSLCTYVVLVLVNVHIMYTSYAVVADVLNMENVRRKNNKINP